MNTFLSDAAPIRVSSDGIAFTRDVSHPSIIIQTASGEHSGDLYAGVRQSNRASATVTQGFLKFLRAGAVLPPAIA